MVSLGMQSLSTKFQIQLLGDHAIVFKLTFGLRDGIDQDLLNLSYYVKDKKIHGIRDIILAYDSLTLIYDILLFNHNPYVFATNIIEAFITESSSSRRAINVAGINEIPVCYDSAFGLDLQTAAISSNCSVDRLIQLHSEKIYTVYCLGFLPGFAYMGDVPKSIQLPRHPSPRPKVLAGSVGIAGKQTGIYPLTSPGGWQIIGRTPIKIFDPNSATLTLFKVGDQVKFKPISLELFYQLNTHEDVN